MAPPAATAIFQQETHRIDLRNQRPHRTCSGVSAIAELEATEGEEKVIRPSPDAEWRPEWSHGTNGTKSGVVKAALVELQAAEYGQALFNIIE